MGMSKKIKISEKAKNQRIYATTDSFTYLEILLPEVLMCVN
jgi:hypothetical protein